MAQFDVHENMNKETASMIPFLLDVQTDMLDNLATRVVVPLMTEAAMGRPVSHLNPKFEIENIIVFMSTAELAGIPKGNLGKKVASLKKWREEIIAALDFLFVGF